MAPFRAFVSDISLGSAMGSQMASKFYGQQHVCGYFCANCPQMIFIILRVICRISVERSEFLLRRIVDVWSQQGMERRPEAVQGRTDEVPSGHGSNGLELPCSQHQTSSLRQPSPAERPLPETGQKVLQWVINTGQCHSYGMQRERLK